tara:strand:+ start:44 stop:496 length:453 start_codon:yes stop_codon:yes gene_type:complete
MTEKGTKSRNWNPIGIFDWCTDRSQQVDYSVNLAKQVFIKKGYRIFVPDNPDTGGDSDFTVEKYPEVSIVSCKSTTQVTRSKRQRPEINLRTNSKARNNYGKVTIPTNYHYMIGISHLGTSCIWTKEDLKDVKSTVAFGCKNGQVEKLGV